jgi:hypothetical protein
LVNSFIKYKGKFSKAEGRKPPGELAIANAIDRTVRAVPLRKSRRIVNGVNKRINQSGH